MQQSHSTSIGALDQIVSQSALNPAYQVSGSLYTCIYLLLPNHLHLHKGSNFTAKEHVEAHYLLIQNYLQRSVDAQTVTPVPT